MKKTKLLTTLGAVALIGAIGVGSTFAYLTAETTAVTNTFTIGNVSFDSDHGLKESTVERYNPDKTYDGKAVTAGAKRGQYIDTDGAGTWTSNGNEYTNLYPGEVVLKDPTVTMATGSEAAWVFALVENDNGDKLSIQYNTNDWVDVTDKYKEIEGNGSLADKYAVYAKKATIEGGKSSTIFNTVTVGANTEGTIFKNITIKACAVQAVGFASYEEALSEVSFK